MGKIYTTAGVSAHSFWNAREALGWVGYPMGEPFLVCGRPSVIHFGAGLSIR